MINSQSVSKKSFTNIKSELILNFKPSWKTNKKSSFIPTKYKPTPKYLKKCLDLDKKNIEIAKKTQYSSMDFEFKDDNYRIFIKDNKLLCLIDKHDIVPLEYNLNVKEFTICIDIIDIYIKLDISDKKQLKATMKWDYDGFLLYTELQYWQKIITSIIFGVEDYYEYFKKIKLDLNNIDYYSSDEYDSDLESSTSNSDCDDYDERDN